MFHLIEKMDFILWTQDGKFECFPALQLYLILLNYLSVSTAWVCVHEHKCILLQTECFSLCEHIFLVTEIALMYCNEQRFGSTLSGHPIAECKKCHYRSGLRRLQRYHVETTRTVNSQFGLAVFSPTRLWFCWRLVTMTTTQNKFKKNSCFRQHTSGKAPQTFSSPWPSVNGRKWFEMLKRCK